MRERLSGALTPTPYCFSCCPTQAFKWDLERKKKKKRIKNATEKQLTKLKATIVWNIEQVIEWLTSVECRAVNVAKKNTQADTQTSASCDISKFSQQSELHAVTFLILLLHIQILDFFLQICDSWCSIFKDKASILCKKVSIQWKVFWEKFNHLYCEESLSLVTVSRRQSKVPFLDPTCPEFGSTWADTLAADIQISADIWRISTKTNFPPLSLQDGTGCQGCQSQPPQERNGF